MELKQNFPLKYFLGDNENTIEIQVWAAMLANLLITLAVYIDIVHQLLSDNATLSSLIIFRQLPSGSSKKLGFFKQGIELAL